jgi:hypothetical protein
MSNLSWPAWFNGPDGEAEIFDKPEDVPSGWTSGAEKITVDGKPATIETVNVLEGERDADGHLFDPAMHTGTKTKAGLWRMKVGVARPAPLQHDL